ncbi:MAG: alanyl-tRNA editing protein [Candidatus Micrarchaeota archaeon]|nr:alanyl-tRNA editing protein [Candidatus Micrarchaeota archaeon]MDE1851621.1 alanyl-tRNA editing protein [Candidatus Micrarchaeota archaeon]
MTDKLYWRDPYLHAFDAEVVRTHGNTLVLDKTAFYPTSGGQQNDTGKIILESDEFSVTDVKEENGEIFHTLDKECVIRPGTTVHCSIDWDRRYRLMRHHTALHIIIGIIVTKYDPNGRSTGGQIYEDRARMDFDVEGFNREMAEKIIADSNAVALEDRKVTAKFLSQEEARSIPNLSRTMPGDDLLKSLDTIRVIEIEGLDIQNDGGTHVQSTKEVGTIRLTKFENNGKHSKRIGITLDPL